MELNNKEQKKLDVIKQVIDKKMTIKEAMYELNISRQQIYRLIKIYNTENKKGFIHKNRGKDNPNKIDSKIIEKLKQLYLEEFYDYNFEHFLEKIKDEYKISYSSLYRYFLNDDIISPLAHKETVKLYNEKMINAIAENDKSIPEEKIDLFKTRQISFEQAHTRRPNNLYVFGQEVQMDACEKVWFGDIVTYLHLAIDKGTNKVLGGWFEYEEVTRGYFVILFNMIVNYGIPAKIKADNRSTFSANKTQVNKSKKFFTQFGKICEELNIVLETTSIATAKANIERNNRTFKDRLIAELRHEQISDIDTANKYLNETFIPYMNRKFSYVIDSNTSKMRPNNYSIQELNLIISEKFTRIIDNASAIKYNNKYYLPADPDTGEVVHFMRKTECTFIITYNAEYWCKIENKYYILIELEGRDTIMKKEIDNDKPVEKKQYIPPKNHPWRQNMMLRKRK